jgi:TolB protein
MKKYLFQIICIVCIFTLSHCDKSEFYDDDNEYYSDPIDPLFDYSTVAFIARITDNSAEWSLCVMDKSGENMRKIVDNTVDCQKPVRSYCGTRLAFTSVKSDYWTDENNTSHADYQYELYIVNIDGTGLTLIDQTKVGGFGSLTWSPDNRYFAYVKSLTPYWDNVNLILYDISKKTHTILPTEGNVCSPKFSPDGKQIAYCATVETDGIVYAHSLYNHHIYKMDVNGSNNKLIIKNAASPKWSPQGDKIMYTISGKDGSSQISVANADGSNQKQLTSSVSPVWWDTGFPRDGNGDPHWTPDGKKIVYVSYENDKPEIFIMNADGSKQTRLTTATHRDENPEITPDGNYILFSSVRSDMIGGVNPGICIMKLDGSEQKVLSRTGICPVACK